MAPDSIRTAKAALAILKSSGDPARAAAVARFFKTGPGQYGEGDQFLGLTVPALRQLARTCELPLAEMENLLRSPFHEARTLALMAMTRAFAAGEEKHRTAIFERYLANTAHINNWDLVDGSAEYIVGATLENWPVAKRRTLLDRLTRSESLWERRIAILATFHFIKKKEPAEALRISKMLVADPHDLIHKAVGWMLREVGKRCGSAPLEQFLETHAHVMPRTMLRYALERLPPGRRADFMARRQQRGGL